MKRQSRTFPLVARRPAVGLLVCLLGLSPVGCNMFSSLSAKARTTVNRLSKRNVDFDRPAPAQKDLEGIRTVAIKPLEGSESDSKMISGYLASYLSDSERFTLVQADALGAEGIEGAAAIEGSIVQANYDERMDSSTSKCGENKTCTTRTRTGTAAVTVSFKLVDVTSGEVLVQKQVEERKEVKTAARDGQPPSIDKNALLGDASRTVAGEFFAVLSPHVVAETAFFETDAKAKSLKEGADRAMGGDLPGAIESFEQGLAQASQKKDAKAIAKANYDLGLALVINGEYEKGLELLRKAQRDKSKKSWAEVILAAQRWQDDAQRARKQWATGVDQPPAFDPTVRPSEDATQDGLAATGSIRALAGR